MIAALKSLLKRPVAYHADLARLTGNPCAAIMLSQGMYWQGIAESRGEEWFFVTGQEWEIQTGLSRKNQETARTRMREMGFWAEKLQGVPARLYFKIDVQILAELLEEWANRANLDARIGQASMPDSGKLECPNRASSDARIGQTIKETKQRLSKRLNKEGEVKTSPGEVSETVLSLLVEAEGNEKTLLGGARRGAAVCPHPENVELFSFFTAPCDVKKMWVDYMDWRKRELGATKGAYKTPETERAALRNLFKLAGGTSTQKADAQLVEKLIAQTQAHKWQSIYALKADNGNNSKNGSHGSTLQQFADGIGIVAIAETFGG